jgi:hypothetical protein
MKGTIVKCLEELVKEKFGAAKWKEILLAGGQVGTRSYTTTEVVPDAEVLKLLEVSASVLKITGAQAIEAFGEHWSTKYAPSIYGVYFEKAKSAREFLLNLDHVHVVMTKTAGAQPPRFTYTWRNDRELVMNYSSARGLVALMPALVRGVGKYYKERLDVSLSGNDVVIRFAA